jgi:gliding motility-associated-like protein
MSNTPTTCNGACNGSATAAPAGGTSPYTYVWNAAGNLATTATSSGLCAGAPSVTVTDALGCTVIGNTTVTQPTVLAVTATGTNPTCFGVCDGVLTANNATGGTAPYSYAWSGGLGAGQSVSGACGGTFTVTVTDGNLCTATGNVTITTPPQITIATTQTNVSCNGGSNGTISVTPSGGNGTYAYSWTGGLSGQNPTNVAAGTYTVTVSSPAGCSQTATITITQPTVLSVSASGTNVSCNGGSNGSLSASASGGTGTITYAWNNGVGAGANHTGVSANTYTVTATDANGCTATASYTVTQPTALTVAMSNTPATCNGLCTGSATAAPAGGTSPYTYQWNAAGNLATTPTVNNVCAGAPSVTVTDALGCTVAGNTTVTEPTAITISTSTTQSTCGNADGEACATIAGGTAPYTQSWSPGGQTTLCATNILAGAYTITVTDDNNCTQTATANVTDAGSPTATITFSSNVTCNGGNNGSATVSAAGGTAPYTYLWNGGTTPTATTTNGLAAGTASVVVTDFNNCQANASVVITQPTALTAAITASTNVSCNGGNNGSATVTANGGTAPYTYAWNNSPSTTVTATGLSAGVAQTVTVTDALNCQITASITLTEPAPLSGSITPTAALCNGDCNGSADLTVAGGTTPYTYSWNDPLNSTSQDVSGLCVGAVEVIITDALGCQFTANSTITQPDAIVVNTSFTQSTCGNADGEACATIAGGTAPYTQSWSPGGQTTLCATNILAGAYTITVTDDNNCTQTATANVTDAGSPTATITFSSNVSCNGGNDGSATVSAAGGTAPYTYAWNGGDTPAATTTGGLSAGTASVVVTDFNNCQANASVVITQPTALTAAITASTNVSCNGGNNGSATVTANGGTAPYTYAWNNSPSTAVTATGLSAGVAQTVTVTDALNCQITASITLTEPAPLSGSITPTPTLCNGDCNGSADLTVVGGTTPYTYSWNDPANSTSQDVSGLCVGPVEVIITDALGCPFTTNSTITQPDALTLTTSATDAHCNQADGQVCVTATGGTGAYSYLWNDPTSQTTSCANNVVPNNYQVTVTDANNCTAQATQVVGNIDGPTATASVANNISGAGLCDGAATVSATNGSAPFTYSWDTTPVQSTQNATGLCAGNYCATVTDAFGCTSTSCIVITEPDAISVSISPVHLLCNGVCIGEANTTVNGGVGPYTYAWTHGPTTPSLSGLCAGTYTLTVTDNNGITATQSVTITEPTLITINSLTSTPGLCHGDCAGTITALASNGTGTLTYNWSGGLPSGDNPTNVCADTYILTVVDDNNCSVNNTVTVTQPTALVLAGSSTNSNCGNADGQACVSISGGTAPYSQLWNDANTQTTICASAVISGNYQVLVTDNNGCFEILPVNVQDNSAGSLGITLNNNTFCNGSCDGSATAAVIGGQAPFTYLWSAGSTPNASSTGGLCAGNVSISVTDNNGCIITNSVTINQPSAINVTTTATAVTCLGSNNGSVTATANGGTSFVTYNYAWINQTTSAAVGTTATVTGLPAGNYCVTVTDDNMCSATSCVEITSPAAINVVANTVNSNCGQNDGSLSVSSVTGGSGVYTSSVWTDASNVQVTTPNTVFSGPYTVTVTDNLGCTGQATVNVNDLAGPTVAITNTSNTLCNGSCDGSATAEVTGGVGPYTLVWSPAPGSGQGSLTAAGLCAQVYALDVTDANGCGTSVNTTINQPTIVDLSITSVIETSGAGLCDATTTVGAAGGTSPYTYVWYTDCTNSIATGSSGATATGLCAGSYGVIVTDANGCTDDICVPVTSPNAITSTVSMTPTLCNGSLEGTATVVASGGVSGFTYQWFTSPANTPIGQTSATATGLAAGNYYVVITDANNITHTSEVITVTSPTAVGGNAQVTSDYNGYGVSCETTCNGTAIANPQGGTAPYTYNWGANANNQTTQTAIDLCFGIYDVTVTDANGCFTQLNVVISKPPTFAINTTSTNDPCNGTCAGTGTVNTIGGITPYTYQWNNPSLSTTASINGLCVGTYTVEVEDANGCELTESITIGEPLGLVLSSSSQGSNCNQNDGSATVTVVSGVAPYTYLWDVNAGNQATATAANLFAACYNVVVTDANNCSETLQVCVNDLGAPTAAILTQTNVTCNGACDGFAQIQITGGTQPYNYSWVDSNGNPTGVTTASNNSLCAGTYTGQMIDVNGCQASVGVVISQPLVLNGVITDIDPVSCFGLTDGSATITVAGGTAPYTYQWNDALGQTSATATNLAPGTYTVNVTDAQDCFFSTTVTINEPAYIDIDATAISAFCNTGTGSATAVLNSGGIAPINYSWNDASNQNGITALNLIPGTYTVTASDATGCSNTASVTVGNIPSGTATLSNVVDVLCHGESTGSVTVSMSGTGTAPYTYNWFNISNMPIGQTSITATNLPTGIYYVIVTDANGCVSTSNTETINQPTQLELIVNVSPTLCANSCDGNAQAFPNGGAGNYSYTWNDALGQNVALANNLCEGNYTVIVTDNNGCTINGNAVIISPSSLTATSTVTNANCGLSDGSGCVSPSGGVAPYSFLWPDNSTNSCQSGIPAGSYCIDITDNNGCQYTHCLNLQDLSGPSAQIINTVNVSCNGGNDGAATVDMIGGNGFFTAQWDNAAGNQVTPTASNLSAGTYGVTITDSIGCTAATSVTIIEPTALVSFLVNNPTSCFSYCDGSAQLNVTGGTQPYSYSWVNNLNTPIGSNQSVGNLCAGTYNVILEDANGCDQITPFTITQPVQVTGTTTITNVTCFGACNGTATASGLTGIAPFTYQWNAAAANQTTATAAGLCPGTYTCTITDATGCFNTVSATITEPILLTVTIPSSQNVSCFGLSDGFAVAQPAGGTAPYNYTWSNFGGSNATAINLASGNYVVTVTDANGCTANENVFINQPTQLVAAMSKTNVSCFGACNGTANVSVSGGTPNYSYQWDNPGFSTTAGLTNLCNGIYNVIITDNNGCQISSSVNITQPTAVNVSANITNSNCGQPNGQICVNTFGGTSPYVYQWNDPMTQTTACASSLSAGCYLLTITDANACFKDTLICLNDLSGPTVAHINTNNVTCHGAQNGSVEMSAVGGTGTLTLQWFNSSSEVIPAGNGTALLTNLDGGCYTFQAIDAAGCIASLTNCVNEPNPMSSAIFPIAHVTCFNGCNGQATVNVNGGIAPYTYSWNNPGNTTTPLATGLCAGTYTSTVTDANGCNVQTSATITQPAQLQLSIVSTVRPLCTGDCNGGGTIGITGGTAPYLISWATNGASGLTNGGLCAGEHMVNVIDANGCSASIMVPLQDPLPLAATANITGATCSSCNGALTVIPSGGTPGYTYNWNGAGASQGNVSNTALCAGNANVIVTDLNGCTFSLNYTIQDAGNPVVDNITATGPTCFGTSTGSASVFVSQGTPNYNYQWNDPFNQTVATAVSLPAGNYCVSVSDQNNCAVSSCVNVTQPTALGAVPDISRTICYGESTQIWASGQGGTTPYTINWSTPGLTGGGPISVTPQVTTNYCFTVTDGNGCISPNACVTITVRDPLAIDVVDALSTCTGLDASIPAIGSGGIPANYQFSWINTTNNQIVPDLESGNTSTINVSPSTQTTYQVTLSDGCSLNAVETVTVTILNNPVAFLNIADSNGCEPFNAQFTLNTDIGTSFFFDVNCDSTFEVTTTNTTFNYTFQNEGVYDICMNVVSAEGCTTSISYPQIVEVYPQPTAFFTADPSVTTILTPYITFIDGSTGGVNYTWNFGDSYMVSGGLDTTFTGAEYTVGPITNPTHTYLDSGAYNVSLTVVSEYGCTHTYTTPVLIKGDYAFYVANAFTPDGDGVNDTFKPEGIGIDRNDYAFFIFNRWGQLIFETYNPDVSWDGTHNNVEVQQDVYVWMVRTKDHTKKKREYVGHVTLVR